MHHAYIWGYTMSQHKRLTALEQWLQRKEDELLYTPDRDGPFPAWSQLPAWEDLSAAQQDRWRSVVMAASGRLSACASRGLPDGQH